MNIIKLLISLTLICFSNTVFGQPDPEYVVLFNIQKDGKILDNTNSKFSLYKLCHSKKRKLKQKAYLNTAKVIGKTNNFRQIRVPGKNYHCEKIILKVKHKKEEMEIHFMTNQLDLNKVYYLHHAIEFIPQKLLSINLANNVEDRAMNAHAIGSSAYKWVLYPAQNENDSLFVRPAKLKVDSIIYSGLQEWTKVQFTLDIGIDSLMRRFPKFCYNQCAKRLIYNQTFEIYRWSESGKWIDAREEAGLLFPIIALCQTCDLNKVIDDSNAYHYFQKLNYNFSLTFKKFGAYKIISKEDSTINTLFTLNEFNQNKSDSIPNQEAVDPQKLIGDWELINFSFDTIVNQNPPPDYFKNRRLIFGENGALIKVQRSFGDNYQGLYFLHKRSLVFYIKAPNEYSDVTPRAGPHAEYHIKKLDDKILILTQEGGVQFGRFESIYVRH